MIGLYVCIGRKRSKRFEFAKERVTIGSDASCDIVLRDGDVPPFHGALVRVRERWFLSSRGAEPTAPDRMRTLEDGARLQVGAYTIVLAAAAPAAPIQPRGARAAGTPPQPMPVQAAEPAAAEPTAEPAAAPLPPTAPMPAAVLARALEPDPPPPPATDSAAGPVLEPLERSLVDAILRGDEDSRLVYADWLEGRGDALRAEFLRLQRSLSAMDPDPAQRALLKERLRRLGELAPQIDFAWRRLLGRPVVEGCHKVVADFRCKMDWGSLTPTEKPTVRHCHACGDNVYYVATIRAAREHVARGNCIAVDLGQHRSPNDLEEPLLALRSPRPYLPPPP
jgi:uncharacterized protein (TIGR02996 family)